ncbi:carbonic anhydrase [Canibacter sp. lx-45]|uniref:carbonic anhydrase n=1 Tax=Canibacter zhuwentaonis TaxID=2837491 RepID=UPI001BDD5B8D|nr:carbonic anhydrase [Canibacter zhuwentaonis]MBT1035926.1 carbonic anhydrase [Canibacter zhuwentaonis]
MVETRLTPQQAWLKLLAGNTRFVTGKQEHPNQDTMRRDQLAGGQFPDIALFGCADSRIAAEIIFDLGLGDLFVIRNIGHIVAESIVASLEFAVSELGSALIVVLAHDSCSAVKTAIELSTQHPPVIPPAVERTLAPVLPAVQQVWHERNSTTPYVSPAVIDADAVGAKHLELTLNTILRSSVILRNAVASGSLGIVACKYSISRGQVELVSAVGPIVTQ